MDVTSRCNVFVIYDDKSHYPFQPSRLYGAPACLSRVVMANYPSTYNVLRTKIVICEKNIYQLNLVRRFKNSVFITLGSQI